MVWPVNTLHYGSTYLPTLESPRLDYSGFGFGCSGYTKADPVSFPISTTTFLFGHDHLEPPRMNLVHHAVLSPIF